MTRDNLARAATVLCLAAAFAAVFFLRLPVSSETFCDPDLGTPAYTSRLWLEGECPYAAAVITKPAGTPLLYALLFSVFGRQMTIVYRLAVLWTCLAVWVLYALGKRIAGRGAGLTAGGLYAFYQADLMSAGICPNFESWTILPSLLCLWALVAERRGAWRVLAAGACLGVAVWMKQTAAAFLAGALLFLWLESVQSNPYGKTLKPTGRAFFWLGLGVLLASLPFLAALAARSCGRATWDVLNPFQMKNYVGAADRRFLQAFAHSQLTRFGLSNGFLLLFSLAGLLWILIREQWQRLFRERLALVVFLLASFGSVFLGSRFYGHYFVVALPYLCLLVGAAFGSLRPPGGIKIKAALLLVLLGGAFIDLRPELALGLESWSGYRRDGRPLTAAVFAANRRMEAEPGGLNPLLNHLELQPTYHLVGDWARERLRPGETVWSLDYLPEMYFYTQSFSPTRHQENFEWVSAANSPTYGLWHDRETAAVRQNRRELLDQLRARPPRFIFRYADDWPNYRDRRLPAPANWPLNIFGDPLAAPPSRVEVFPELENWLNENYRSEAVAGQKLLLVYEYSPKTETP
ncbi:MAG: glycosyltransferase family 39 protein [Myxococcales bacterium]|nr:glycosyltransferase family 39 protein [Myxococcales bacterium]